MTKISPNDGGCWFCEQNSLNNYCDSFTTEFDAYFHMTCLEEALKHSTPESEDREAEIIGREFNLRKRT